MTSADWDAQQIELFRDVDGIREKYKENRHRMGIEITEVIRKHVKPHLPKGWTTSPPNSFVQGVSHKKGRPVQFDLLVVREEAIPTGKTYLAKHVGAAFEIKSIGMLLPLSEYKQYLAERRSFFDQIRTRSSNPRVWGALLTFKGTINPKRLGSINYEQLRKDEFEPHGCGVYTFRNQRMEPQPGTWRSFVVDLKLNLLRLQTLNLSKALTSRLEML